MLTLKLPNDKDLITTTPEYEQMIQRLYEINNIK